MVTLLAIIITEISPTLEERSNLFSLWFPNLISPVQSLLYRWWDETIPWERNYVFFLFKFTALKKIHDTFGHCATFFYVPRNRLQGEKKIYLSALSSSSEAQEINITLEVRRKSLPWTLKTFHPNEIEYLLSGMHFFSSLGSAVFLCLHFCLPFSKSLKISVRFFMTHTV